MQLNEYYDAIELQLLYNCYSVAVQLQFSCSITVIQLRYNRTSIASNGLGGKNMVFTTC